MFYYRFPGKKYNYLILNISLLHLTFHYKISQSFLCFLLLNNST